MLSVAIHGKFDYDRDTGRKCSIPMSIARIECPTNTSKTLRFVHILPGVKRLEKNRSEWILAIISVTSGFEESMLWRWISAHQSAGTGLDFFGRPHPPDQVAQPQLFGHFPNNSLLRICSKVVERVTSQGRADLMKMMFPLLTC